MQQAKPYLAAAGPLLLVERPFVQPPSMRLALEHAGRAAGDEQQAQHHQPIVHPHRPLHPQPHVHPQRDHHHAQAEEHDRDNRQGRVVCFDLANANANASAAAATAAAAAAIAGLVLLDVVDGLLGGRRHGPRHSRHAHSTLERL